LKVVVSPKEAIELYPPEGKFWYKKGLALEALGRESKAQMSFFTWPGSWGTRNDPSIPFSGQT
jgi:hypothetical protein